MSSTATWDEIKRLAADFQRVQLTESSLKLSERNCIELINKLIELDMIKVYHSMDGKEYITEKQLERDICDELYVHEGRINQCELQTLLNIDISHIEKKVAEIVKNDPNLVMILGQVISKDYMNKIAEEINELLQEKCRLTLSELTTLYELPTAFMLEILTPRVGSIIKGNFDGQIFYTINFVNNQRAILTGALEACIKPIRVALIVKEFNLESGMIFETFDSLISSGQIKGSLFGGRQEMSAVFVPEIYIKAQEQYVRSFFKQNGYIEYSSLKKIGITEPDSYVRNLFKDQTIEFLSSSCFADYYLDQMGDEVEEMLSKDGYCDLSQVLPSCLNEKDLCKMTSHYSTSIRNTVETTILAETYLISNSFMKKLGLKFQEMMEAKSKEDLKQPSILIAFRTENAVLAGSASTPTNQQSEKKTKGKGKKNKAADESKQSDDTVRITFIDKVNLEKELSSMINDLSDDLLESLVENFLMTLNQQYFELLKTKIETGLVESSGSQGNEASPSKKVNTIKDTQEKIKLFLINAKIFEKGVKSFTDNKTQDALSKHLIKTVFTDIVNEMFKFIATEQMISFKEENFNNDTRTKIIQKLKEPLAQGFNEVHHALHSKPASELVELIEKCAVDFFELSMKKQDLKREKEILLQLRESTKSSLETVTDAATALQLTCILLYHQSTNTMVNFPGRLVPTILEALKDSILEENFKKLLNFQNLIIENLTKSKEPETENQVADEINSLIGEIREIGLNAKASMKPSSDSSSSKK